MMDGMKKKILKETLKNKVRVFCKNKRRASRLRRTAFILVGLQNLLSHFLSLRPEVHQVVLNEVLHVDALADDVFLGGVDILCVITF